MTGTIAVVGNAELACDFGEQIDRHDVVIRCNAFEIAGHERLCGRRTTDWCTFGETPHNPMPRDFRRRLPIFSPFTADAAESANVPATFRRRLLYARLDYRCQRLFPRPSTGVLLLRLLEAQGRDASVFGFDGFTSGHYFDPSHAHDPNHGAIELLYLLTRPCFRIHLYGTEPLPTLVGDPLDLRDQILRGDRIL